MKLFINILIQLKWNLCGRKYFLMELCLHSVLNYDIVNLMNSL